MSAEADKPNLNRPSSSGQLIDPTSVDVDAERVDHLVIIRTCAHDPESVETVNRLVPTQIEVKPSRMVFVVHETSSQALHFDANSVNVSGEYRRETTWPMNFQAVPTFIPSEDSDLC
jgi:hypothetical protein